MKSYSQLKQDLWVLDKLNQKRNGIFIEVGANNGVHLSNTYLLEKDFGWTGVLVECDPNSIPSLRENRPNSIIIKKACYSESNINLPFKSDNDSTLSVLSSSGDTFVQSISLNDICGHITEIDYISLDIEGFELNALSTFDFNKYNVKCWTIEHNLNPNNQASVNNYFSICSILLNNNYLVKRHDWDFFAIKDDYESEFYKNVQYCE
jgi:FkbM family methyltransferase